MKQKALKDYRPNYPKKLLRGTALAAAALLAVGGAGCRARTDSAAANGPTEAPIPTEAPEELVLDGEVAIEVPGDEGLVEMGEPAVDEGDDLVLDGEVAIDEYPDEYDDTLLGGEPLPDDSYEEEDTETDEREEPALMGKIAVFDEPEEP